MPELSRFHGIVIRMYAEAGPHHSPHLHAYYGSSSAVVSLQTGDVLAGGLPARQRGLVEDWMRAHRAALDDNWRRLQSGESRRPIDPLP